MGYRLAITMFALAMGCQSQAAPPVTPHAAPEAAPAPAAGATPSAQDRASLIGHMVTFKMKPGREAEATALLSEFAAAIDKKEPGTLVFYFFRVAADPQQVVVVEMYKDQAARDAHKALLESFRPRIAELFDMSTFKTDIQIGAPLAGVLR